MKAFFKAKHHRYHLVDPSPWPALARFCMQFQTTSQVQFFHQYSGGATLFFVAITCLTITASLWWRDVVRESIDGSHTQKVKNGQYLGMMLFIWSERMFFIGFLWRVMHRRLMPTVQIGLCWPPVGIIPINWSRLPITNTQLLLSSYFTANRAMYRLDTDNKNRCKNILIATIAQGVVFEYCQYIEFIDRPFSISDSIYGSTFFAIVGQHGLHVIFGIIFQTVCLFILNTSNSKNALAMNQRTVYWHFVDIVWVFVLTIVYVWAGTVPEHSLNRCNDAFCTLATVQHDTNTYVFQRSNSHDCSFL